MLGWPCSVLLFHSGKMWYTLLLHVVETVPPFVTAHTFWASQDVVKIQVSFERYLQDSVLTHMIKACVVCDCEKHYSFLWYMIATVIFLFLPAAAADGCCGQDCGAEDNTPPTGVVIKSLKYCATWLLPLPTHPPPTFPQRKLIFWILFVYQHVNLPDIIMSKSVF